ncbi:MAG TPA: hypothetical protein VJL81_07220 [Solirubrobacterales bacterium]|nr:hypothetical protein [Solirubrobacterales bacterium]
MLLASALALTACGGGSSSSSGGSDDETAIEEAIETAATSSDPSKCTEVQTAYFNETETGKTGEAALKVCEEEAEDGGEQAESVTVSNIEVEGTGAAAIVAIEGSPLNGQTIAVAMEKEEGDWKLDGFMGFIKYDPAGIASAIEGRLKEEGGANAELAPCVAEGVEEMSEEEAEAMVFEKESQGLEEIAASCNE